jgi:type VI secretion system protein ImpC
MAEDTKTEVKTETAIDLKRFLSSMRLPGEVGELTPMVQEDFQVVREDVTEKDRFVSGLAAILLNLDPSTGRLDKGAVLQVIARIDTMVNSQINEIIHQPKFKALESSWRSLSDLVLNTNFRANIMIDLLDVAKDELFEDFEANAVDITGSALFKKVYVSEYDQYGGKPIGSIVGLYEFEHTPRDEFWLKTMGRISAASHSPFVGSMSPKFFGCESVEELAAIKDLEGLMNHPKYGSWNKLRESEEAAYLGLTLPRYVCRLPWDPEINPCGDLPFKEEVRGNKNEEIGRAHV